MERREGRRAGRVSLEWLYGLWSLMHHVYYNSYLLLPTHLLKMLKVKTTSLHMTWLCMWARNWKWLSWVVLAQHLSWVVVRRSSVRLTRASTAHMVYQTAIAEVSVLWWLWARGLSHLPLGLPLGGQLVSLEWVIKEREKGGSHFCYILFIKGKAWFRLMLGYTILRENYQKLLEFS